METVLFNKPLTFGDNRQIHYLKRLKNQLRTVTIRHLTENHAKRIEGFFKREIVPENDRTIFRCKIVQRRIKTLKKK